MGAIVIYILEWTACLLAFLLLYKMCFSGSTFHRFNRLFLLGSVILSAILPMIHINLEEKQTAIVENYQIEKSDFITNMRATEFIAIPLSQESNSTPLTTNNIIALTLIGGYLVYVLMMLVGWSKSCIKMLQFIHGKPSHKLGRWMYVVSHDEEYGPFSWMNYIVISTNETGFDRKASMRHELAHVSLFHYADLVFLLFTILMCPACWLVMQELKIVHEYEADDEVINRYQIQSRDYQRLLIRRTVGAEAYALASSFNLNIKKRIIMMKKKESTWWRILWIMITVPLVGMALTAFSKPKEVLKETIDHAIPEQVISQLTNKIIEENIPTPSMTEQKEPTPVTEENMIPTVLEDVTGTVVDENGDALTNARIIALDKSHRILSWTKTNEKGEFKIHPKSESAIIDMLQFYRLGFEMTALPPQDGMKVTLKAIQFKAVTVSTTAPETATPKESSTPVNDEEKQKDKSEGDYFEVIELVPEYPGGQEALTKYISDNLKYPQIAAEYNVEGTILMNFTIDKRGFIKNPRALEIRPKVKAGEPKITKGDDEKISTLMDCAQALAEEATYVVRNMPRWSPGKMDGEPIEVDYTIPINFELK